MGRQANPDIRRAFVEFNDDDTPSKCNRVRCIHCGFVRAKNTTRQIEHLQSCNEYLNSPSAQDAAQPETNADVPNGNSHANGGGGGSSSNGAIEIFNGTRPNPNLQVQRRGPNTSKRKSEQAFPTSGSGSMPPQPIPRAHMPSLTTYLLSRSGDAFTAATQQPFLSHAGCGSLASAALSQWLTQDGHYARGYVTFIGALIAKVRLPLTQNSQFHVLYRTLDLLISALNNIRREMSFFEITATKYGLQMGGDNGDGDGGGDNDAAPTPICRAYLDLFHAAASPAASLLEGLVLLWATEHCYRAAWSYAASFSASSSLTPLPPPTASAENHILALHHALIPNWTSPAFSKFVDASRALVDELANESEYRHSREIAARCEELFAQVCWLEERFWPVVDGMGEESDGEGAGAGAGAGTGTGTGALNGVGEGGTGS